MARSLILVISVFSFVMLSFVSLTYCYAGDSDSNYSGKIEVNIDTYGFDISNTYLDCHSYGSCHVGAHVISTILPQLHVNFQSSLYDLTVSDSIILQRLYPPFQPPIS